MRLFFFGPRILGVRPGISLGPEDFRRSRSRQPPIEGAFLYLIVGPPGLVKVGVTTDPRPRLAALQTGSPYPLKFAALLAVQSDGYALEAAVHLELGRYQASGEWFQCSPMKALFAIKRAADALQEPVLAVTLDRAEEILAVARSAPVGSRMRFWQSLWFYPAIVGIITFCTVWAWLGRVIARH